jgi:2-oxoglutarate ferredoxin oxidoreductase subunit gamma
VKKEIKFIGVGGQGVLLASAILAKSASVFDGLFAVLTEKYTSDMRGGEVSSEVVISSRRVTYPLVDSPDILIALSQDGCDKYASQIKPGGTLIYDSELVAPSIDKSAVSCFSAPFNAIAINDFKNRSVMNMIVLGFVSDIVSFVSYDSLKKAMAEEIDSKFLELNYKAFEKGVELGKGEAGG